jgi:hypothetical protein
MHLRRLAVLLIPIALGLLSVALPGRAQNADLRYADADTTLLRDTLGLSFDGIFPLADSLRITPDTLRALSIRYRAPLWRIVRLADSLGISPNDVAALMEKEKFNPLAQTGKDVVRLNYSSTYSVQQTSSTWTNALDWNRDIRSLFLRNNTSVQMDRFTAGGATTLRQVRSSVTESGWRFSPDFSAGGRLNLERFDNRDAGGLSSEGETKNEMQMSLRSRQRPAPGLSSELNFFSGFLDLTNSHQVKRGWSGALDGRVRYTAGNVLTNDLSGQVTGTLARTRVPSVVTMLSSRDQSRNLSGTLGLFGAAPVSANLVYRTRYVRTENPTLVTTDTTSDYSIQPVVSENNGVDLTVRGRLDADRQLNVTGRYSTSRLATAAALNSLTTGRNLGLSADGRYALWGVLLEGQFQNTLGLAKYPRKTTEGGYGESTLTHSLQVSGSRALGHRLSLKANGRIALTSSRYYAIGSYGSKPTNRDQYSQSYRLEALYTVSRDLNSGVALEVGRSHTINLLQASSGSNSETRSYRGEWRWNYRLLPDLSATQRNTVNADYLAYDYRSASNRLTLYYQTTTTLNAVLSPRFNVTVTHNLGYQPSGNYTLQSDGTEALTRSDETQNYTLTAGLNYQPTPGVSLSFEPNYLANDRSSTVSNTLTPQRQDRSLNFSGGANLNLPIGRQGHLIGDIRRTYRAARATSYTNGVLVPGTRTSADYWNGSLQLTWEM